MPVPDKMDYCENLFERKRFPTREVMIGSVGIGGSNPIRVQSMTTKDTMDTEASIEECIRMIEAGCEIVRLTAPSIKEAENLGKIKAGLRQRGYDTPLVADIHFTPNAAEVAAKLVEKVRVNPGNYADKKKFEQIDYDDNSYQAELNRIEEKFTPLVKLCKAGGTAMRIGTNHGSLSDRILSRYGDTPQGMVASAMEFIKICRKNDYHELVISMKASNTVVMVQAYRLLVAEMKKRGMNYPLHLGVTEAGDGEDGRIKSAVGIGALLEDGLGDTIRVSLTEPPEAEIPVAQKLLNKYKIPAEKIAYNGSYRKDPFHFERRTTKAFHNIGGKNHPIVIADLSNSENISQTNLFAHGYQYSMPLDKWNITELAADYAFVERSDISFKLPGTLRTISSNQSSDIQLIEYEDYAQNPLPNVLIRLDLDRPYSVSGLPQDGALLVHSSEGNRTQKIRRLEYELAEAQSTLPVIFELSYSTDDPETFQLHASADAGIHFIDGFGDGIMLRGNVSPVLRNSTSFGILQATRTRISKTEYISCPSCGRTLFDLQETTAKIRKETSHLKGIKIGIMGCIVNGPGEMADADYGYVGTGPGKIHLYKEKTVVRKNVPESEAVQALIELIKEHGDWVEPKDSQQNS